MGRVAVMHPFLIFRQFGSFFWKKSKTICIIKNNLYICTNKQTNIKNNGK